jgi:hypothetical protein
MRLLTTGLAVWLSALCAGACTRAAGSNGTAAPAGSAGTAVSAAAAAAAPAPEAPPAGSATPESARRVTIPAGTHLPIVLDTAVGSDISRIEEPVTAHLAEPLVVGGETVLPPGTRVTGIVTDATRSGRVKGRAHVAIRFDSLAPRGEDNRYRIRTSVVDRTAPGTKKKDAFEIGAPAAGGALIGALLGGKKGVVIGGAAGAGAGTAVVLSTRGKEVHLSKGAVLTLRLSEPVTIRVSG